MVKVAIVQCDVPLWLSRAALGKLGMIYHVEKQRADLTSLNLFGHPLEISSSGHPALCVSDFEPDCDFSSLAWSGDLEVRLKSGDRDAQSDEAYKVLAAVSHSHQFQPIFYPKKIPIEVHNLLVCEQLSRTSFLAWWKEANQSKDFWIETHSHLIRVHVVPRLKPFDPSLWQTGMKHLKLQLMNSIGNERNTDVIPCHADGLLQYHHHGHWKERQDGLDGDQFEQLWVGRSCFPKAQASVPEVLSHVCAEVAMEDEPRGTPRGAERLSGGGASPMDCARAPSDSHRTTRGEVPQGGDQPCKGVDKDVLERAGGEGDRAQRGDAPEANSGFAAEAHSRPGPTSGGACHDLRQVQGMALPGGAGGVYGVGHQREEGQSQLLSGPDTLCELGDSGAAAPLQQSQGERGLPDSGRSGGQSCGAAAGLDVGEKLEIIDGLVGECDEQQGSREESTCGGGVRAGAGYDAGHDGGGEKGARGAGDQAGHDQAEAPAAASWTARMMDRLRVWRGGHKGHEEAFMISMQHEAESEGDEVPVEGDAIGLSNVEYEAAVGHSNPEYKAMVGSGKMEYKDTIGLGSKVKYDKVTEYKDTVGLCSETEYEQAHVEGNDVHLEGVGAFGAGPEEMRERAKAGIRRRKAANKPLKKKLYGMANRLHQVMLTCAFVAGTMACEKVILPGIDLCDQMKHRVCGEGGERPSIMEIFAGSANISGAFAKSRCGVMRPVDLVFGDDLRKEDTQNEIFNQVKKEKPQLLWFAPPCTEYCAFSRLNYTKQERRRRRKKERVFLEFIDRLIVLQLSQGGDIVIENPMTSDIWHEPILARWCGDKTMSFFRTDLCHFGLKSVDGSERLRKPIKLLASNPIYQDWLEHKCDESHGHKVIQGAETRHSAEYPMAFAEAVVKATQQIKKEHHEVFVVDQDDGGDLEGNDLEELIGGGGEDIKFKGTVKGSVAGAIKRLHQNLGHPPARELIKHLRLAGAGEEMIAAADAMRCRTCEKCADPKPHRISKPAALLDFNEAVALDIIFLDTTESTGNLALNMVDLASTYQVVIPIPNRKSQTVAEAFHRHWISWAGVPGRLVLDLDTCFQDSFWELTSDHGIAMRAAAGQAHWQNGVAERYGSAWKSIWTKLCTEHGVRDKDILDAACAVSEARNTLRNRSGFSPRQWVFGSNGKLLANLEEDEDWSAVSAVTADAKMGRKHALKIGARTAFFELQNVDSLKRALSHKSRVQPRSYHPGDLVYIFREDPSGKKSKARWIGPATVIGAEGSNYWTARGGRCILAAREHLRPADHEEVSLTLRIKAAIKELEQTIDKEFEEFVDDEAMPELDLSGVGGGEDVDMSKPSGSAGPEALPAFGGGPPVLPERRRKAEELETQHKNLAKQARYLDDLPQSIRRNLNPKQAFYVKKNLTGEALEKSLDKELPWSFIPEEEKEMYREAERKQWQEHMDFGAVRPLSLQESREVEAKVDKSRIISSRFFYRDKNRSKRRLDTSIPCRPKARLCVGGQRDPDLGVIDMAVDALHPQLAATVCWSASWLRCPVNGTSQLETSGPPFSMESRHPEIYTSGNRFVAYQGLNPISWLRSSKVCLASLRLRSSGG